MPPSNPLTANGTAGSAGGRILLTLFRIFLTWVSICLAGRILLFGWQWPRLHDLSSSARGMAFVHGLRMDTMAMGYLLLVPMLLLTLAPARLWRTASALVRGWTLAILLLLIFVEVAGFPFFAEYDVRPNILIVEYLSYPKEVASMLWKDQKAGLGVAVVLLLVAAGVFLRKRAFRQVQPTLQLPWIRRAVWCLPLLLLLLACVRSSFGHRAANLSDALYSPNRVANEIAKNSLYSVGDAALRAWQDGGQQAKNYGALPMQEAYARVARLFDAPPDPLRPFQRSVATARPAVVPRNLVILVEESMGAQFVGFTGGAKGLTPRLDDLAKHSLAFENLFSNGTRSIRGLSAMSAGFLPLVGDGVIKRSRSQSGFFSLASLLKPHGYQASFIYGGEARFDNMKAWYLGNGFDEVIEQKDFPAPRFVSTWGVSDEDLFLKAHERFKALSAAGKPFVSVVFSSSNHVPFELPEHTFEWVPGVEKRSVQNAIKYADYAVGRFFDLARTEPYYANTVFVVVADHNVRVYGDDVVPVDMFHIPALIHCEGLPPQRFSGLSSQPDVLATALDLLGLDLSYPILGNSILKPGHGGFVLMQFNDFFGFRRGDKVAVFRPGKPPRTFSYQDNHLGDAPADPELEQDGLALIQVTEDLYLRRLYR